MHGWYIITGSPHVISSKITVTFNHNGCNQRFYNILLNKISVKIALSQANKNNASNVEIIIELIKQIIAIIFMNIKYLLLKYEMLNRNQYGFTN